MNNDLLTKYKKYQQNQKINIEIANLNTILSKIENSYTILTKQKKKSLIVGLITGLITILILTLLIIFKSTITIPLFMCNVTMGLISGISSKIIYYKETTKELREIIKNNNPIKIKKEIATLKAKTNPINPPTNYTKIKTCSNISSKEKNKVGVKIFSGQNYKNSGYYS